MTQSVAALLERLVAAEATLSTAESVTGGRLAAQVTAVPGASGAFVGGVVSYATDAKTDVLGVAAAVVAEHGVVSAQCAEQMALGARRLFDTTWSVSTTGVAGPDRQEGKPVGTVFVGLAGPGVCRSVELSLSGTRAEIQEAACRAAWAALDALVSAPGPQ